MKAVTKDEFFSTVEGLMYHMVINAGTPESIYVDSDNNLVAKATWGYPETLYEVAQ
ncbi:hypothetical protein GY533_003426 [Escherichia coli]|jgi:hypothetical protein|nr:hypothetical protein [Escherichia coli]